MVQTEALEIAGMKFVKQAEEEKKYQQDVREDSRWIE
jgi:hypothetical protein